MGDFEKIKSDLSHIVRLGVSGQNDDLRMFAARLVRKYRDVYPDLSEQLSLYLQNYNYRKSGIDNLRKSAIYQNGNSFAALPIDGDSRQSLLKKMDSEPIVEPLLRDKTREHLLEIIYEHRQADKLFEAGLMPAKSAIFVGPPGVGKTLSAKWLASQLQLPLYVLDLSTVMSSLLGKTGNNIRSVLDFARKTPCVLFLDEIDAIAKRRSDESDVGELKRLVTVMLQEIDEWTSSSLLLAATNYPELIDPALWRRFDLTIHFELPDEAQIRGAIQSFLDPKATLLKRWVNILTMVFKDSSLSDIEKEVHRLRKRIILNHDSDTQIITDLLMAYSMNLNKAEKISLSIELSHNTRLSQHAISKILGISRDTIRKRLKESKEEK